MNRRDFIARATGTLVVGASGSSFTPRLEECAPEEDRAAEPALHTPPVRGLSGRWTLEFLLDGASPFFLTTERGEAEFLGLCSMYKLPYWRIEAFVLASEVHALPQEMETNYSMRLHFSSECQALFRIDLQARDRYSVTANQQMVVLQLAGCLERWEGRVPLFGRHLALGSFQLRDPGL